MAQPASRRETRQRMSRFYGTHPHKLDSKGRISVPASFRATLDAMGVDEIVLFPSFKEACIECYPAPAFERLADGLDRLEAFSDAHDDMATALFAKAYPVKPDAEGRIVLPPDLIAFARLDGQASFVAHNRSFRIWAREAAEPHVETARGRAMARGLTLPAAG
jgi:MraZ protein